MRPGGTVRPGSTVRRVTAGQAQPAQRHPGQPRWDVHQEDPVPAQVLGQPATGDRPGGQRRGQRGHPHRGARVPLPRGPARRHDRQARGQHQRRPRALRGAGGQQHRGARREAGRQRRPGEQRQPGQQHRAGPVPVGQPPAGEHQRGEREQVAGHCPLQLRQRHAQVPLDRGQRDIHDRAVDRGEERGHADHAGDQEPASTHRTSTARGTGRCLSPPRKTCRAAAHRCAGRPPAAASKPRPLSPPRQIPAPALSAGGKQPAAPRP